MIQIDILNISAQRFQVVLDDQYCTISLRQKGKFIYMDLDTTDIPITRGAICQNLASIVQNATPYFTGSLHFFDTLGDEAPFYEGLNERWVLLYVAQDEELPEKLLY